MRTTVRFGRLAGIEVGANWSVLVILILVAEGLAVGLLPDAVPDRSPFTYWATAIAVAVLLLGCLLAHELAHAIVAHRAGIQVEGITLWMLGGVTRLIGEPASARTDLAVAAAGPATSVAIGALLLGAAVGLSAIGVPATTEPSVALAGLAWLGWINLVLAVFNVLPGAPLDGGRILRALLWWRGGDRVRAAVAATRAGTVVGAALITLGVADALAGGAVGGLWLALIGWFLVAAAAAGTPRDAAAQRAGRRDGRGRDDDGPRLRPGQADRRSVRRRGRPGWAASQLPAPRRRRFCRGRGDAEPAHPRPTRRAGNHQVDRRRDAARPRHDRTAPGTAGRSTGPPRRDRPRATRPGPRRQPPRRHPHPHRRDPRHVASGTASPARRMRRRTGPPPRGQDQAVNPTDMSADGRLRVGKAATLAEGRVASHCLTQPTSAETVDESAYPYFVRREAECFGLASPPGRQCLGSVRRPDRGRVGDCPGPALTASLPSRLTWCGGATRLFCQCGDRPASPVWE